MDQARDSPHPRPQCSGNQETGKEGQDPRAPPTHSAGELGPSISWGQGTTWSGAGPGLEAASRARARAEEAVRSSGPSLSVAGRRAMFQGFPGLGERDLVLIWGAAQYSLSEAVGRGARLPRQGSWKIPLPPLLLSSPHPCPRAEGSLNSIAGRVRGDVCLDQCWPTPSRMPSLRLQDPYHHCSLSPPLNPRAQGMEGQERTLQSRDTAPWSPSHPNCPEQLHGGAITLNQEGEGGSWSPEAGARVHGNNVLMGVRWALSREPILGAPMPLISLPTSMDRPPLLPSLPGFPQQLGWWVGG